MKTVNIYTDGACSGNQNEINSGGWGCILEFAGKEKELSGGELNTTNNRMELTALVQGLSALKEKGLQLRIFSDSSYLISCFKDRWYVRWQSNGWKTGARKDVENRDLWEMLLQLLEGQQPVFYLVKGHLPETMTPQQLAAAHSRFEQHNGSFDIEEFRAVCRCNARCDRLATDGAKKAEESR